MSERHEKMQAIPEGGYAYVIDRWYVRPPGSPWAASIENHDVTLHDDQTITVSPSILYVWTDSDTGEQKTYHGYLEHGQWRSV